MSEVKSTMDIIMEKAEKLTVTDQDKKEFAEKEVQGRVKGLFQKYLDGILSVKQLKSEMALFSEDRVPLAEKALLDECSDNMDIDGELQPFLDVLERVLGRDIIPVLDLIDRFQEEKETGREKKMVILMRSLADRGVSGTAVIANTAADRSWREYLLDMNDRFRAELKGLL
jgi:hypothetical protein